MKKAIIILLLTASTALFSFKFAEMTTWKYDNTHAKLGFSVSHMTLSDCDGYFKEVDATLKTSKADMSDASVEMTAQVKSVNTDNAARDEHLINPDFFDAAKYPTITFKSTSIKKSKVANAYVLAGNLTMHGVTKPVSFAAIIKNGINPMSNKETIGVKLSGKINRKDYKIAESTPDTMVGEEVEIRANAEFIKE